MFVPAFFCPRYEQYGYVLNGMLVIIGTITMAHFSYAKLPVPLTAGSLLLKTTLADILLLSAKFALGKALFDLKMSSDLSAEKAGISWRYPNMGWWWAHLAGIFAVYSAGHLLWR